MDKTKEIERLAAISTLVYQEIRREGVIAIHDYLDRRKNLKRGAGVHLCPEKFFELFGDDEFEYRPYYDEENIEAAKEVNGVTFYAIIDEMDVIPEGRLD